MSKRTYWIVGLFAVEVLAVILVFQIFSSIECRLTSVATACHALHDLTVRFVCVMGAVVTLLWFSPGLRHNLATAASEPARTRLWMAVHALGVGLIFGPWLSWDPTRFNQDFEIFLITLSLGGLLAAIGGVGWLIPYHHLNDALRRKGYGILAVTGLSFFIPDLASAMGFLWYSFDSLLLVTFYAVAVFLSVLGNHVTLNPDTHVIGTGEFFVEVASACSGIEGFALTTGFMAIYAVLMRDTLRQGRYWGLVLPAALLVSWMLNVVRISVLILIGANYSPTLAVDGFHSFAGWLFFTVLALGILGVVQVMPGLHKGEAAPIRTHHASLPFRQDPSIAQIVPFMMLMLSGLVALTFWQFPELGYPWQVLAVAGALWLFRKPFLALKWSLDPVAIGAGAMVGIGWLLTAGSQEALSGLDLLAPGALSIWVVCRIIGTSFLVPVVEEAFFRGYLLRWMAEDHKWPVVIAVVLSSLGFALLHGRIVEAGLAGIIFALVYLRRHRLSDAILAHVVANTLIAIAALMSGNWSLI